MTFQTLRTGSLFPTPTRLERQVWTYVVLQGPQEGSVPSLYFWNCLLLSITYISYSVYIEYYYIF